MNRKDFIEKFLELSDIAYLTGKQFRDAMPSKTQRLDYICLGLGEIGEVMNKVKKIRRDKDKTIENQAHEIAKEIGDVLWYITALAQENVPKQKMTDFVNTLANNIFADIESKRHYAYEKGKIKQYFEYDLGIKPAKNLNIVLASFEELSLEKSCLYANFQITNTVRKMQINKSLCRKDVAYSILKINNICEILYAITGKYDLLHTIDMNIDKLKKRHAEGKISGDGDNR